MNIIDRNQIHPEVRVHIWHSEINDFYPWPRDEIVASIQHWKNILVEQGQIGPKKKVGAAFEKLDLCYITFLYAAFELGAINLVLDRVPNNSTQQPRCRVLAPFDLFVCQEGSQESTIKLGRTYSKQLMNSNIWFDYVSTTNSQHADVILAQPHDICLQATTTASTGNPRAIDYSHSWLLSVGEHCRRSLGYANNDRVLHLSNLHHGGSSGCFFFPTFKHCQDHFFIEGLNTDKLTVDKIVQVIVEKKINRVMFPTTKLLDCVLKSLPELSHDCYFYTLQANLKPWIEQCRRTNLKGIISIFGASEVLGPIFLNTITPNSDSTHDVLNYGKPLSDFYSVTIIDDRFHVVDCTGRSAVISDRFEVDQHGNYHYKSRSDMIRINEVIFEKSAMDKILNTQFNAIEAAMVIDTVANKIFLAVDRTLQHNKDTTAKIDCINRGLADINPILKIDFIDYVNLHEFSTTIKINRELMIEHFRKKFNLL